MAGMQQMYNAIRSTGATNLVFVDGLAYSNEPPPLQYLVKGTNVVYAAHDYGQSDLPGWQALSYTQPVMITELTNPSDGSFTQAVIDWAEKNNIGWIAYEWNSDTAANPSTVQYGFLSDLLNFNPAPDGVPVKNGLKKNAPSL